MTCTEALDFLLDALQPAVTHLRREGFDVQRKGGGDLEIEVVRVAPAPAPPAELNGQWSSALGYTGEVCPNPNCRSVRMVSTGACSTCQDCGTTGGCG